MTRHHLIALAALAAFGAGPADAVAEEETPAAEATAGEATAPEGEPEEAAESAADGAPAAPAETAAPTAAAAPAAAPPPPSSAAAARVPERLARIGRVETVLLENDDAESALDFGLEALRDHGEDVGLRLLLGACLMRLDRPADAATHFESAANGSASGDPVLHMHALFSLGRALMSVEGREADAAAAYERYVTFVRAHADLPGHADRAEAWAAALRNRAEFAASSASQGRRR